MTADPLAWVPPVRSGNVFEETIEHLVRLIRLGQFPPGGKLPPERQLAEALGVSRTTLREGLGELQQAGYLEIRRGRYGGSWVCDVLPESPGGRLEATEIEDVLTLRGIVEPAAAALAARRTHSEVDLARLRDAERAVREAAPERYRPLDARLHLLVAELAGAPSLTVVVADVRTRLDALLDRIPMLHVNLDHANAQHRALVEAVADGDDVAAERVARDHVDGTALLLRGFLG